MPTHVFIPKSACSLLFHLTELTKESHVWLHERVTWCIPTHDIVCQMKPVMGKMLQWSKKALTGVLDRLKTILWAINSGCLIDFMTWCIPSWHHGRFNMKRDFHSHCTAVMLQHALWLYFTVQYILLSQLVMTHHLYVKWKIALLQNWSTCHVTAEILGIPLGLKVKLCMFDILIWRHFKVGSLWRGVMPWSANWQRCPCIPLGSSEGEDSLSPLFCCYCSISSYIRM